MNKNNNSTLTGSAKLLRKNMTKEKRHLWYDFLKSLSVTVNRQKVIGEYIVDFYIASFKIAIEIDAPQQYEDIGIKPVMDRDSFFKEKGIKVLKYSNADINMNFDAVCKDILSHIGTSSVTL